MIIEGERAMQQAEAMAARIFGILATRVPQISQKHRNSLAC
jgi:hypothetical protein